MDGSKVIKLTIVLLILLLTIDIGSRLFFNPSVVNAKSKIQYKVVSLKPVNTTAELEKLLNDMANQGWEADQVMLDKKMAIFKK